MAFVSWCRLRLFERKLYHGAFGKYSRYRCLCLKRNAQTIQEKIGIATEVLNGPGVNTMEAQYNELYIREQQKPKPAAVVSSPMVVKTTVVKARPAKRKKHA